MTHQKIHAVCVVGTRPEVIKMAPIIWTLQKSNEFKTTILATAQHRQMLDQFMSSFNLKADIDLNLMRPEQPIFDLCARTIQTITPILQELKPDVILSQGDTTTVLSTALAAFYTKIPFAHVEAGLRSHDMQSPWPEEMNRRLTDHLTELYFCPTEKNKTNLMQEGLSEKNIFVVGNTVIDTLLWTIQKKPLSPIQLEKGKRLILVTAHRRESFGKEMSHIFEALLEIANSFSDITIVYPVHPNPNVKNLAYQMLNHHPNIKLIPPVDYFEFVALMDQATLILTDSGGVQEEAPSLGKPVLVLRKVTERTEALDIGLSKLVGTDKKSIMQNTQELLKNQNTYQQMSSLKNPFGDGQSSQRIKDILCQYFSKK